MWQALHRTQRAFAAFALLACRYQEDVAPFAAVANNSMESMQQLRSLCEPGGTIALVGERPFYLDGLLLERTIDCLQMVLPETAELPVVMHDHAAKIVSLSAGNVPAMLALTTLTAPGPFRKRTLELGSYYGIFAGGELVAMAGERIAATPFCEVSAVCTHQEHLGRGYAAALIAHILHKHRRAGIRSILHVASTNDRAIVLYRRLGFVTSRAVAIHQLTRIT